MKPISSLLAREATIHAEAILELLDQDLAEGLEAWRRAPWLTASIVRSYLEENVPDGFEIFNPRLTTRIERVRAKLRGP